MTFTKYVLCAALATWTMAAGAADEPRLKPFVLASRGAGDLQKATEEVKGKLGAAGFTVAGTYEPYPGAVVLAVTADDLRAAAAQTRFGGYAAAQRVTLTKVGDELQVAYTNPVYMAAAYRLKADLAPVAARLAKALGALEAFGPPEGITAKDLDRYRYMFGMPRFDDPWKLAFFGSHAEAVAAVEAGLASGRGGTKRVYRIDVSPDETVFGVALADGCGGDASVMHEIDFKPVRSTAHLPYEILVSKTEVRALHAKFRIAVNFPDLSMMGAHSFMKISCAPDSIEAALAAAAGATGN
ncbi:MAG TPA: hypothetical protein VF875_05410 [Anaeromyxobacter sp.]